MTNEQSQSVDEKTRKNARRSTVIHPKFQYTIIGFNLVLAVIAVAIFYVENMILFSKFTDPSVLPPDPVIQEFLTDERRAVNIVFLITSLFVFASMIIGGLILSNRVAGPVYHVQKFIEKYLDGTEKGPLKFRRQDFFPELAESVNRFIARVKELHPK